MRGRCRKARHLNDFLRGHPAVTAEQNVKDVDGPIDTLSALYHDEALLYQPKLYTILSKLYAFVDKVNEARAIPVSRVPPAGDACLHNRGTGRPAGTVTAPAIRPLRRWHCGQHVCPCSGILFGEYRAQLAVIPHPQRDPYRAGMSPCGRGILRRCFCLPARGVLRYGLLAG